jgi:hypothetical protein
MPRSRYLILTAVPPGDGRSADVELTARRRPSDRTITEMGNAKRSAKNITISMAGASAHRLPPDCTALRRNGRYFKALRSR